MKMVAFLANLRYNTRYRSGKETSIAVKLREDGHEDDVRSIPLRKPRKAENGQGSLSVDSVPEPPCIVQTEREAESVFATLPMPQVSPKLTKPRSGQRQGL